MVSGPGEVKSLQELLPGILTQMGPESMDVLRQMMSSMGGEGAAAEAAGADEEIPDLEGTFEEESNK